MDILPTELTELILSYCDDDSLILVLPSVSKIYRHIISDDSPFWKRKCAEKYGADLDVAPKPSNKSWKQFYIIPSDRLKLFPLYGFTIGHSTLEEINKAPGAKLGESAGASFVTVNHINFWSSSRGAIFRRMYLVRNIYPVPTEWQEYGFSWNKSWNQYKRLLKAWNKNYKVESAPHYKEFQNRQCFTAQISSIVQEEGDVLYKIQLDFSYTAGNEDSEGTLYSITLVSCRGSEKDEKRFTEQRIEE